MKYAEQAQLATAGVLNTMHLPARKKNAGAWLDRRVGLASPHATASAQDAEHFLIVMDVIGRTAGRNSADELGRF